MLKHACNDSVRIQVRNDSCGSLGNNNREKRNFSTSGVMPQVFKILHIGCFPKKHESCESGDKLAISPSNKARRADIVVENGGSPVL